MPLGYHKQGAFHYFFARFGVRQLQWAMPLISFKKNRTPLDVPSGANLMKSLLDAGLPVASSCDGEGVCAKCKILVIEGAENLSAENDIEVFLKEKNNIPSQMRISCQTEVLGDITVDATYW